MLHSGYPGLEKGRRRDPACNGGSGDHECEDTWAVRRMRRAGGCEDLCSGTAILCLFQFHESITLRIC